MDAPRTESGDKMVCFEAIRGLAAFAVLVGHFLLGFWPGIAFLEGLGWDQLPWVGRFFARSIGKCLWNGHTAVSIFFVLSGFVLSLVYFRRGSAAALGSAAVKRYPRLMIPIAGSVLLAFVLLSSGAFCNQEAVRHMNAVYGLPAEVDVNAANGYSNKWLSICYYNFAPHLPHALREAFWGSFNDSVYYNPVLWTMGYELIGSFLVYGFLALFGSLRNRWLLYLVCGGLLFLSERYFLMDFLLGVALCDLWVHNERTWQKSLSLWPALLLVGLGVFVVPWKPLAAVLVVGATAASPHLQQRLSSRWLAFLGRISFSLYLLHMVVFCSLGCGVYLFLCRSLGWGHAAASLVASLTAVVGSVLAAWGFYHAVDRSAITLTRWLDVWLFKPKKTNTSIEPTVPLARAA